jgi:hypothetical protein
MRVAANCENLDLVEFFISKGLNGIEIEKK